MDPFAVLGCGADADEDAVRSAFRRLALEVHPDKDAARPDVAVEPRPTQHRAPSSFSALVDARDRAIASVRGRSTPGLQLADARQSLSVGASWAIGVACSVLSATTARPIDVDLSVSFEDLYHARVKKVGIGVHRVGAAFVRQRQMLFVRLVNPARDAALCADGAPMVFAGIGDDPPASVLLGRVGGTRGDVHVRVRVEVHPTYSPDPVLYPCDLHANVAVGLRGHYLGETVALPHPGGGHEPPVTATYGAPSPEGDGVTDATDADTRQVRVFRGMGLPYAIGGGSKRDRGDLYVFMTVQLPRLTIAERDALAATGMLPMRPMRPPIAD
jgi:hypothetical protein